MKKTFSMFASGVELEDTEFDQLDVSGLAGLFARHFDRMKYGGSKCGLMARFAQAFSDHGGTVIGVFPTWLKDIDYVGTCDELVEVSNLAERKAHLLSDITAILCLPGGVGTLDEAFTYLAEFNIGGQRNHSAPVFFFDHRGYYRPLELMLQMMNEHGALDLDQYPIHFFERSVDFERELSRTQQSTD